MGSNLKPGGPAALAAALDGAQSESRHFRVACGVPIATVTAGPSKQAAGPLRSACSVKAGPSGPKQARDGSETPGPRPGAYSG